MCVGLLYSLGFHNVLTSLRSGNPAWLIASIVVAMLPTAIAGVRLAALSSFAMPLSEAFASASRAASFNMVLPGRLGESDRVLVLAKYTGKTRALALIAADNATWMLAFMLLVALTVPAFIAERFALPAWLMAACVASAALAAIIAAAIARRKIATIPGKVVACVIAGALMAWLCELAALALLLRSYGVDASNAPAVISAVTLGLAIPIPAGLGIWEVGTQSALAASGVEASRGIAIGLAYHASYALACVMAWGLSSLFWRGR